MYVWVMPITTAVDTLISMEEEEEEEAPGGEREREENVLCKSLGIRYLMDEKHGNMEIYSVNSELS